MNPDSIKTLLAETLNVAPDSLTLTRTPTGKFNETWFAESPDFNRDLIIRIAPPEIGRAHV